MDALTAPTGTPAATPAGTPTGTTQDLIARLWARFRPLAVERVDLVAALLLQPGAMTGATPTAIPPDPRPDSRTAPTESGTSTATTLDRSATCAHGRARQAAHDLAGALGSYGRPEGSAIAARLEALLDGRGDAAEGPALVDALRREVER